MKKYIYLVLILFLSFSFMGCNSKSSTPVSQSQSKSDAESATTVDYYSVVQDFLKQKNLKILANSGATEDIQLPRDFKAVKDEVTLGELLKQRNELSKQNGLDFGKYMGQKVKIYTAGIDTGEPKSNYDIVLFIAESKVVGYWIDAGMKDPKQNRPDFNVLVSLLI